MHSFDVIFKDEIKAPIVESIINKINRVQISLTILNSILNFKNETFINNFTSF
jgi:hypothetical protein